MGAVEDVEDALLLHWSNFGRVPGGKLHEEDGIVFYETPLRRLPYNGVIRTRLAGDASAEAAIERVCERTRARDADLLWIETPNDTPADLGDRLQRHGLDPVEPILGMSLELDEWAGPGAGRAAGIELVEVLDKRCLDDYIDLTAGYWELEGGEREEMARIHRFYRPGAAPGHRYLAYSEGRPVGKGYLSVAGPPGVAAVYGMSVSPKARGRGIAAALTDALLLRAREEGFERVVLHSTEMATGVYRWAGFRPVCPLTVYATAALWSGDH